MKWRTLFLASRTGMHRKPGNYTQPSGSSNPLGEEVLGVTEVEQPLFSLSFSHNPTSLYIAMEIDSSKEL